MAASETSICNMALAHLAGTALITALGDGSREGALCEVFYANSRDEVLARFDWAFASHYQGLADIGGPPANWTYRYAYPSNCVAARQVIKDVDKVATYPFRVTSRYDATTGAFIGRALLTDVSPATLRYTARVINPEVFTAGFINALSYRLAYDISEAVTGRTREPLLQKYMDAVSRAMATDANEAADQFDATASWITARA